MNTQKQLIKLFTSIDTKREFIYLEDYQGIKLKDFEDISSEIIDINTIELISTQHIIDEDIIKYYHTQQDLPPAFGVKYKNKIWVLDGHHRLVHWIQQNEDLRMKVIHLNKQQ